MTTFKKRSLTVLITLMAFFAFILVPKFDAKAETEQEEPGIYLLKDKVESSVYDPAYVHYLYIPSADYTKVVATVTLPSGKTQDSSMYVYGKSDFCYYKATAYSTGTYPVSIVEYKQSGGNWVKTGVTAKATITIGGKKVGWNKTNGEWCYYNTSGVRQYGWQKISGKWYYLDDFFGAILTGWNKLEEKWYYFDSTGAAATGWKQIKGKWYHFNGGAAMDTGWTKISNKWYYFKINGIMVTGWQKIGGKNYYFETSGAMVTGWKQISGKWYYFKDSGVMAKKWLQIDSKWYYFGTDGVMVNGWQEIDGNWYYFRTGVMCTGKVTIAGKTYKFDKNGVYQK